MKRNSHPIKVEEVKDYKGLYANTHPYKVEIEGGGGGSYSDFTPATDISDGDHGLVPAPKAGDNKKFLKGDGTWAEVSGGGGELNKIASFNNMYLYQGNGATITPSGAYLVENNTSSNHNIYLTFLQSGGQNGGQIRLDAGEKAILIIQRISTGDYTGLWIAKDRRSVSNYVKSPATSFSYGSNGGTLSILGTYNGLDLNDNTGRNAFVPLSAYQGYVLKNYVDTEVATRQSAITIENNTLYI